MFCYTASCQRWLRRTQGPVWGKNGGRSGFISTQPVAAGLASRALASAGLSDGCSSDSFSPFVFCQAGKINQLWGRVCAHSAVSSGSTPFWRRRNHTAANTRLSLTHVSPVLYLATRSVPVAPAGAESSTGASARGVSAAASKVTTAG